jgi:hypothetical protein
VALEEEAGLAKAKVQDVVEAMVVEVGDEAEAGLAKEKIRDVVEAAAVEVVDQGKELLVNFVENSVESKFNISDMYLKFKKKKKHILEVEEVYNLFLFLFLFLFHEQAEEEAELHAAVQELQAND